MNEHFDLSKAGISPVLYIDPMAMVSTPFDRNKNLEEDSINAHGTVGVGFGTTVRRHQFTPHKLYAYQLKFPTVLEQKLNEIEKYYKIKIPDFIKSSWLADCAKLVVTPGIHIVEPIISRYEHLIFEGSQGILLDEELGFFPHVTHSRTNNTNIALILDRWGLRNQFIEEYLVMRSYRTRHGNGPMSWESDTMKFEDLTNVDGGFQGKLRFGSHDMEELKYALASRGVINNNTSSNIVITCLDQTKDKVYVYNNQIPLETFVQAIKTFNVLKFNYETKTLEEQRNYCLV
jgi:adenylosuccinate synthase